MLGVKALNYDEFERNSQRSDSIANNNTHFFASIFSNRTAFLLYKVGLTPNGVTWLFLWTGILSVVLIAEFPIVSYLLWRAHIILDMADGTIARATKNFSSCGMGFDRSNHTIINNLLLFVGLSPVFGEQLGYLIVASLLIAFNLSYNFNKNYEKNSYTTQSFAKRFVIIKNLVGLEGLVLGLTFFHFFQASGNYFLYLGALYSLSFFSLVWHKTLRAISYFLHLSGVY